MALVTPGTEFCSQKSRCFTPTVCTPETSECPQVLPQLQRWDSAGTCPAGSVHAAQPSVPMGRASSPRHAASGAWGQGDRPRGSPGSREQLTLQGFAGQCGGLHPPRAQPISHRHSPTQPQSSPHLANTFLKGSQLFRTCCVRGSQREKGPNEWKVLASALSRLSGHGKGVPSGLPGSPQQGPAARFVDQGLPSDISSMVLNKCLVQYLC